MKSRITINVKEASELLGLSVNTVYAMARNNQIPHLKARSRYLFNPDVLVEWTKNPEKFDDLKRVN